MAKIVPDFTELVGQITPGVYNVRIIDSKLGQSQAGNPWVQWTLETFGCTEAENNGRKIITVTQTTGKGAFRLQDLCRAATGEIPGGEFDTEHLHGRELTVIVEDGVDYRTKEKNGFSEVKTFRKLT